MKRSVVCFLFFLLLPVALLASSASVPADDGLLMIKVLRSDTRPLQSGSAMISEGCSGVDYSPTCMHASDQFVQNMMVVQSEDGKTFTITCTIESKWSNCVPLPVGESFRARVQKNGLTVAYIGSKGRPRKQEYKVLPERAFDASTTTK